MASALSLLNRTRRRAENGAKLIELARKRTALMQVWVGHITPTEATFREVQAELEKMNAEEQELFKVFKP